MDKTTIIIIAVVFALGMLAGATRIIFPLARHPHLHMYWSNQKLITESMLIPQKGLRDMNGNKIKPGDIIMMLDNGYLLKISTKKQEYTENPEEIP